MGERVGASCSHCFNRNLGHPTQSNATCTIAALTLLDKLSFMGS